MHFYENNQHPNRLYSNLISGNFDKPVTKISIMQGEAQKVDKANTEWGEDKYN